MKNILISLKPIITILEPVKTLTALGNLARTFRSKSLMRAFTFKDEPVDCLLFAIEQLQKGEEGIPEALKWLNQTHQAYLAKGSKADRWHQLAEIVRLDIMTQLNGLRLTYAWKLKNQIETNLTDNELDYKAREKYQNTLRLLIGLIGYHLGSGLEISDKAINQYTSLLAQNPKLKDVINERITALTTCTYLDPAEFGLDKNEFNALRVDRQKLDDFVNKCCVEGLVPTRPEFEAKYTKDMHFMAGLSVFAGPLALIVIPVALGVTPVFRLADRIIYAKDQKENANYYAILDEATVWIAEHIQEQAKNKADQTLLEDLLKLQTEFKQLALSCSDRNLEAKAKDVARYLDNNSSLLGEKWQSLSNIVKSTEHDFNQFSEDASLISRYLDVISSCIDYVKDNKLQLKHNDGKYHPKQYGPQEFAGTELKHLPASFRQLQNEFRHLCDRASSLANDVTSRLNGVRSEIDKSIAVRNRRDKANEDQASNVAEVVRMGYL